MRSTIICAAILSLMSVSTVALAEVPAVKTGMMLTSADGKRVGRVYDIDKSKDGAVQSVIVIRDSKIVRIAASTLTANDKGLVTSLNNADIAKLK